MGDENLIGNTDLNLPKPDLTLLKVEDDFFNSSDADNLQHKGTVGIESKTEETTPAKKPGKKRGRKPGQKNKPKTESETVPDFSDLSPQDSNSELLPGATDADYLASAEISFDAVTGILSMSVGSEWEPRNKDEREGFCKNLARYYKSRNVTDISPGWLMVLTCAAYSAPRVKAQNTSSKLKAAWTWTKVKIFFPLRRIFTFRVKHRNEPTPAPNTNHEPKKDDAPKTQNTN